jgi:two-component system, sensor histidine kinase and response regulator
MNGPTMAAPEPVKCLIVDDLEENLLALAALLRADGVQVLQARSGVEALELLLTHDVALALLDVQMPEMDGFQLAELMRGSERTRHVPIVFVTAGARDQQRVFKGYETGAVDFLYKPIEARILRSKADVFFQLYRQKRELARNLQERTETLRLNEMFTAVLGHDLRDPLNTLLMGAQMLARHPDANLQKVGERLLGNGRWMGRMIEDMLDLARARHKGGIPIVPKVFDMGELVARLVQERRGVCPERTIALETRGDLAGRWDEDRITQVITNLLGNALRHGDTARPVRVELDGTQADEVGLTIQNHGAIPPEVLPFIFDPFRSGRQLSARSEGLGLGLYIVQQIVLAHRGRLEAVSSDGETTSFEVRLPRRSEAA